MTNDLYITAPARLAFGDHFLQTAVDTKEHGGFRIRYSFFALYMLTRWYCPFD